MFSVPEFIGGNVLIHPPIKTLDVLGIPIDRRKCIDDSSNQKFERCRCPTEGFRSRAIEGRRPEAKSSRNEASDPLKSSPGASKIDPGGLQETPFFKTFILGVLLEGRPSLSGTILSQNQFQNEAQEASRSRPKPSKIDVEKHDVFGTDFSKVRTSLWEGFWVVF